MTTRPQAHDKSHYRAFEAIGTRWADNDAYGHANNVAYHAWFDTAVNAWLIRNGVLGDHGPIGLVVRNACDYFSSVAFPQALEVGIRVLRLGNTSVHYQLGVFAPGEALCAASGDFVHVYVDRDSRQPIALSAAMRSALQTLL